MARSKSGGMLNLFENINTHNCIAKSCWRRQIRYSEPDGSTKWWPAKVGKFDSDDMTFQVQFDTTTEWLGLEDLFTTDVRKIVSPKTKKRKTQNLQDTQSARAQTSASAGPRVIKPMTTYSETGALSVSSRDTDSEEVSWYCRRCTMGNPASASACIMCEMRPLSSRKKRKTDPPLAAYASAAANVTATHSQKETVVQVKTECHDGRYICSSRRKKTTRKRRKFVYPKIPTAAAQNISSSTPPANSEILMECVICFDGLKCMVMLPCSHLCVCESCAGNVDTCPICRQVVTNKHKIYWTWFSL